MDKFFNSVRLNAALCTGCIHCVKRCPTGAIRVRDGVAKVNDKLCIDCGECLRACPHHAKYAVYDSMESMGQYEYKVVLPPPSLYGQFNNLDDADIVLNALLRIGFDQVVEVGAAAEMVSEAARQYLSEHEEQLPFISISCPSVVRLIRMRFPNLIPHLLPFKPPMEVAASMAVEQAMEKTGLPREKIGIFLISPCLAKVTAAKCPLGTEKSQIDRVLAIKDVYPRLLPAMKKVEEEGEWPVLSTVGKIGISWGHSGGEAGGLFTDSYLVADGIENVIRVLEDMEDQKFTSLRFVELNACSGGCVGGALTVENPYAAEAKLKQLSKLVPVFRSRIGNGPVDIFHWTEKVEYEPVLSLGSNMMESFARMGQVEELLKRLPGLDCGACGAPSCRALAEDIVQGIASEGDCVHILKKSLEEKRHRQIEEEME